ncbi:hypothetical protein ACI68E_001478 [Malassezia pachydermatis]|uniref:Ribosome biogenesis related-like protein n=1 Tax=Malassezia pachydermatis TaxID=77020 RepID=A0A0M8MNB0_9BASI|nr:ribosome biogenesis related -like protein [Malassezia pachydermatis]KOS15946.1 ribosome biogenesis related -like protein [Malassezia pachydermatis]
MAKSLRASSKLAARNRKRYTDTSDYAVTAAARLQMVSDRLKQRIAMPKLSELEAEDDDEDKDMEDATAKEPASTDTAVDGEMQVEEAPNKKISTSGPRGSRNEQWRKARGLPMHRKTARKAGKAKRRR